MVAGAAVVTDRRAFTESRISEKLSAYLDTHDFDGPTMVLDVDRALDNYRALAAGLAPAHIHYAVKANPEPQLIRRLVAAGCRFDAASRGEIALCLDAGAGADDISFGNTVKKPSDIVWARARGIDLFAADATEELDKLALHAPGARVYIRLLVEHSEADWPLSRKFGAPATEILGLMRYARAHGLNPVGISFHVGSQTRRAGMWKPVLSEAASVWAEARAEGFDMTVLNIGGGFPAFYGEEVEAPVAYGHGVMDLVREYFGEVEYVMAEPGRGLVADAGVISAEVLLVSRKRPSDIARWVYLDIGKFSGLAETMDEAIRYQFDTTADGGEMGPCVLAGPSCDSADVLYEKRPVMLPVALRAGDRVRILCTGAYTTTYSSVGFNGFEPLHVVCI
ncbi:type III PLP-dependent enzyme [Halovulum dunhuangense]|uniref:ornithine decarboxylase n=2 Tax=Halovulum dunhuangense TaxID=1505036 RepID=A0A849KZS3_9RHOB|nr:type III PLP-dependent enzyme [Halovulum dunhuangense]